MIDSSAQFTVLNLSPITLEKKDIANQAGI